MEEYVNVIGVELGEDRSTVGVDFDVAFNDIGLSVSDSVPRRFTITGANGISFNNILFFMLISLSSLLFTSR